MRGRRALTVFGMVVVLFGGALAGCVAPRDALGASGVPPDVDAILGNVRLLDEGGFMMDVPVEVFLLGFPPDVAEALQTKLPPEPVEHDAMSLPLVTGSFDIFPAPGRATAHFVVRDLDATIDAAFLSAAAEWKLADATTSVYDANAAEAWIAAELERARGARLDRGAPVFVIVHAGELGDHAWRYTFHKGSLEGLRIFGERLPVTIFDVSAAPDPYVFGGRTPDSPQRIVLAALAGPPPTRAYDVPIAASGDDVVDVLAELAVDTVHLRLLKGPLYPVSTKPCHHVTLLFAVHQSALTEVLPGHTRAEDYVDAAGLEGAFRNLTGDEVVVELKTLKLPVDDPVLDALSRAAGTGATLDAIRDHFDQNWRSYVTPREGCEEYLSMLLFTDPTGETRQFNGIGMYDVDRDRRISFSIVTDLTRIRRETAGPLSTADPTESWDAVNFLYSHETGHLFGQQHPHFSAKTDGEWEINLAFDAVYSSMSYQHGSRTSDFGAVDFATWTRGRVGYSIADAQALGLQGTPEFEAALGHLEKGHWTAAHLALEPLLASASATAEGKARLPAYSFFAEHDEGSH